jgi:prevent-host-death family protein
MVVHFSEGERGGVDERDDMVEFMEKCESGTYGFKRLLGGARSGLARMYIKMYIVRMSSKYSVAEARANLSKILDEVELGHEVEVTRRGKAVAVVMSVQEYERLSGGLRDFGEALAAHREAYGGVPRSTLAGLRDKSPGRKIAL